MSFNDVIKNSVLESFSQSNLSVMSILVVLAITMLLGLYLYGVYRVTNRNAFYNKDFNKTLALMPVITAGIVLAMQSSLVISLGMVGALSIVRFRNAVKDTMDLVYLFWSISIGIICGARLYVIALVVSIIVTVLVIGLDLLPTAKAPYLLVVNSSKLDIEDSLTETLNQFTKSTRVKSRNMTANGVDLIIEIRTSQESQLVSSCAALPGIESVSLLAHDGETRF